MKRFLKNVALFSSVLIIAGTILECMLRRIPNIYIYKRNLIEQKAHEMKNIIIGSSVVNYGIDPAYFADSTYNLSINGQWVRYNQALLEKHINQLPQLKNVIWGFCYHTLWSDDCSEVDKGDVVYHRIYCDIAYEQKLVDHLELLATGSIALKKWSKYYLLNGQTMQCDSLGFDRGFPLADRSRRWKEVSVRHARKHTAKDNEASRQLFLDNQRRMHEVAKLCHERGIRLHLVLCPVYKDYYDHINPKQLACIRQSFQEMTQCWNHVYAYDYFEDKRFIEEDFHDGNHLSSDYGSRKMATILYQDMEKNLAK